MWFESRPKLFLAGVGKQVLNDGPTLSRFFIAKERLARHPAVLQCEIPAASFFTQTDDDVDAVVLHVERLATSLNAVSQNSHRFLAENGFDSFRRIVGPF